MKVRTFVCLVHPLFLKPRVVLGTWEKERKAGRCRVGWVVEREGGREGGRKFGREGEKEEKRRDDHKDIRLARA